MAKFARCQRARTKKIATVVCALSARKWSNLLQFLHNLQNTQGLEQERAGVHIHDHCKILYQLACMFCMGYITIYSYTDCDMDSHKVVHLCAIILFRSPLQMTTMFQSFKVFGRVSALLLFLPSLIISRAVAGYLTKLHPFLQTCMLLYYMEKNGTYCQIYDEPLFSIIANTKES